MHRALMVFEPPDGGVAEQVLKLTVGLRELGWEIEVAGPAEATIYPSLEEAGISLHRYPRIRRGFGRPWKDLAVLASLIRLMRSRRFDLVHCHSAKAGVLGRIAAAITRTDAVYSPHCFPFIGDLRASRRAFALTVERALGPLTAALICVCDEELRIAERHRIAPNRLWRVYNAADPCDHGVGVDPGLAELARRGPVAGAIAVMRRQKRLDVFIRAAPLILDRVDDAIVVVVGDGPDRAKLEGLADELGLTGHERFHLLGFRPPSARYLLGLDVFVLPSSWEAFPISLLEAMACGVPQVATDVGGSGEAISPDTGVLVPPAEPARIADAVVELLQRPERRREMAGASVQRVESHFTQERMRTETARVYEAVVAGSAGA